MDLEMPPKAAFLLYTVKAALLRILVIESERSEKKNQGVANSELKRAMSNKAAIESGR